MIILIAAGSILGCCMSLHSMYSDLVREFTSGVDGDGICIMSDLQERADCSINMCTIAGRYLTGSDREEADRLSALSGQLSAAVSEGADISRLRDINTSLEPVMEAVYNALESDPSVSEKDAKLYAGEYARFISRGDTIRHDHYNTSAADYNEKTSDPFAKAVIRFTPAKEAVIFY